ncbi:MAG: YraN family protein [Lentisphaeraceae bacterium]|nr:YraN family protein [Lentisphaeraceae bacterium]
MSLAARLLAPLAALELPLRGALERLRPPATPLGPWGESWAALYLRAHGCQLLARNCRPARHLELDLVARHGRTLLFVEVKTRRSETYGPPRLALTPAKRDHLRKAATAYLAQHGLLASTPYRFDAIEVIGTPGQGRPTLRWLQHLDFSHTRAPDLYC